jgi:hypothetical protein
MFRVSQYLMWLLQQIGGKTAWGIIELAKKPGNLWQRQKQKQHRGAQSSADF